jgi:hypothetical protein
VQCAITSETFATVPANGGRLKIGAGEDVLLTVSRGPATWRLQGDGIISPTSGTTVVSRASDTPGPVTITAQGAGCSCSITFTVVQPASVTIDQYAGTWVRHTQGAPDCGFLGQPYVHPGDVSFYNVKVRELNSAAVCDGYYKTFQEAVRRHRRFPHLGHRHGHGLA